MVHEEESICMRCGSKVRWYGWDELVNAFVDWLI